MCPGYRPELQVEQRGQGSLLVAFAIPTCLMEYNTTSLQVQQWSTLTFGVRIIIAEKKSVWTTVPWNGMKFQMSRLTQQLRRQKTSWP